MLRWLIATGLMLGPLYGAALAQGRPAPPSPADGGPRGDPYKWFTDLDYPAVARGSGAEGKVSVVLNVDSSGRVDGCRVTTSSGNASLDQTTCWLAQRRGRFFVRKNAASDAVPYTYALSNVVWHSPRP